MQACGGGGGLGVDPTVPDLPVEQNLRIVNEMEKVMRVVVMIGLSTILFKSLNM